jgi:hypothetical protein
MPLLDPDTVSRALAAAEPARRDALERELARVRERAVQSGASAEQLGLAEGLVLALALRGQVRT